MSFTSTQIDSTAGTEHVTVSLEDRVLRITLNRVNKKNALTQAMYSALAEYIQQAQDNTDIHCLLLTGHQDCFCAGNDIQDFIQSPMNPEDSPVLHFLLALAANKKPLIVAANGPCIGIGATLMLHCDQVILGEHAKIRMPFVDLGLCPEAGASILLPKQIGIARSNELLLLGNTIDADTALNWGLASAVAADTLYQNQAYQIAKQLAEKPINALLLARRLSREHVSAGLVEQIKKEAIEFAKCVRSPEAMAAFTRFMRK